MADHANRIVGSEKYCSKGFVGDMMILDVLSITT